jgi:undecaprenyl-diphosphatase
VDKRRWSAGLGATAIAVALLSDRGQVRALDHRLFHAFNRNGGPIADAFFKSITEFGSIWASVGATLALARMGRRREAVDALGAAAAAWTLGQILKRVVRRPRPYQALDSYRLLIAEPSGTTFPSSHPAVLLAFVTVASRNLGAPTRVRVCMGVMAGAVGLSRVYLGVHYPADVLGGMLLGRSVAEAWSSTVSPLVLEKPPSATVPGTVTQ